MSVFQEGKVEKVIFSVAMERLLDIYNDFAWNQKMVVYYHASCMGHINNDVVSSFWPEGQSRRKRSTLNVCYSHPATSTPKIQINFDGTIFPDEN